VSVEITKSTADAITSAPNFQELIDEYAEESAIYGLPHPAVKIEMYKKLESSGTLNVWSAVLDGGLVGFIAVLCTVIPHYGMSIAVSESYFVALKHRHTGAGLKLLRAAQDHVDKVKAPGFLISAPIGSNLAEVLPHVGYVATNTVFFRKTKDA
jgi:L-amino acid N-acyltransferase YncA